MTSQYHYGIYSQNRAAERHILHYSAIQLLLRPSVVVSTECRHIVAKRASKSKSYYREPRKSYMRNRLIPK